MNKLRILMVGIFVITPLLMFAQMTVQGTVTDQTYGEPLPGVNIKIQGTSQGASTDFDGNYVINKVQNGQVLEFSFIGYKTQYVTVSSSTINVVMQESAEALEEVVVIGYGTAKKEDLTGSVNMVTAKDFNKGAVVSTQELITGKIAGVSVTSPDGAPGGSGAINIRGLSSLSLTNDPLYVIDGFPIENNGVGGSRNVLDMVNPNDIESVVILKDASATAIYGSRAANGVVMITTKKGKDKDFDFSYGSKLSYSRPTELVDVLNTSQFIRTMQSLADATGNSNPTDFLGNASTDWQREIYQDALSYNHDFSTNGSLLGVPVRLSLGYADQDGTLKTDHMDRTTAALSVTPSLLNDHLKLELNVRGSEINNVFANKDAIGSAIRFDPTHPVLDDSSPYGGYFTWMNGNVADHNAPFNPVAQILFKDDTSFVQRLIGNAKVDYKLHFFPDVTATVNVGMDHSDSEGSVNTSINMPSDQADWNGSLTRYTNKQDSKLLDSYLTYNKDFNDNNFKLMAGYSYQSFEIDNFNYDSEKQEDGLVYEFIDKSKSVLLSYFSRLNFNFKDRYLLTASMRADASSKLNPDDRWGFFPSVALAWNIHNEAFMSNSGLFNELKLRVGYGEVGNVNGLGDYNFLTRYTGSQNTANYQFGDSFYQTYRPDPINKELTWEIGRTTNIGLDFAMLDRRLSGSLNVYQKETLDMIAEAIVDPFTNFSPRINKNIGDMVNKGVELELSGILVQQEDTNWRLNYNIAYNKNEVTRMPFTQDWGGRSGGVGGFIQLQQEGSPMSSFYVYEQVYDEEGSPIEGVVVDRNDDGIINNEDKYLYKDPFADIMMGLSTTLNVNNFDLSISARSNIGNYMYDNVASTQSIPRDNLNGDYIVNLHSDYLNSGFMNFSEINFESDYYITDASFVKIDNITMGYTFPDFMKNADIRLYGTLQNVATFTKYKGLDPEIWGGIDNNFYPRPRTVTFGFNLNF